MSGRKPLTGAHPLVAAVLAVLSLAIGCGGSPSAPNPSPSPSPSPSLPERPFTVYLAETSVTGSGPWSHDIGLYQGNVATGALTRLGAVPLAGAKYSFYVGLATHPSGRFLYATAALEFQGRGAGLWSFAIAPDGALTPLPGSPLRVATDPATVTVDPTGRFVYVTGAGIDAFRIDGATGALSAVAGPPFHVLGHYWEPDLTAIYPRGPYAFIASQENLSVNQIDADGGLVAAPISKRDLRHNTREMALDPLGRFVFVLDGGHRDGMQHPGAVRTYAIDARNGALGADLPWVEVGSYSASMTVEPAGRFAYVTNAGTVSGNVAGFSIDPSTGVLRAVPGSPDPAALLPLSVAADPSGRFLYVADYGDRHLDPPGPGGLWAYRIDPASGRLTPLPGVPFAAGQDPRAMATVYQR